MNDRAATLTAIFIVAAVAVAIAFVAALRIFSPAVRHIEPDPERYPVRGLDISAHNGDVDFRRVADAGYSFVYIKASEGNTHRDNLFRTNAAAAAAAGMDVGAYHFFRFDCDGVMQARNFLAATDSAALSLPVAIDIEEFANPADVSTDLIQSRLESMVTVLRSHGLRVVVYTNKNGHGRFLSERPLGTELWICSFTDPPIIAPWTLWQYSHKGRVDGIHGDVDLDTFNGSRSEYSMWKAYSH